MGVDIYSNSGVVVTAEQLTAIVCEENREHICRLLLRHTATLLKSLKSNSEFAQLNESNRQSQQRQASLLTQAFQSLNIASSVEEIRAMLKGMTQSEVVKECKAKQLEALGIWSLLINELHPNAPSPEDTVFIGSPRYQGWDLPRGEVLFVFRYCFEQVKTQDGRALDEMLGEKTSLATWTTYSA